MRSEFSSVTDFEREFPSLCFALATGVGKTRLMGASLAYLHAAHHVRHFFVLAPNLTIYNKLIADFTPGNPKYVLQGLAEYAQVPPEIITGDNYESGRGVREERQRQRALPGVDAPGEAIHINIFNVSKINSEVRGGRAPRIKRLSEYIGESYFDYLAGLDDLVLLMDESHRYRASAGIRAINELKPVIGLELTATPRTVAGQNTQEFKNVIYSYPLSSAIADGFVKEPAVATRENFTAANHSPEELERIKLEDGVRIHESTKVELETYGLQNEQPVVKPFMLVVAQDTTHANELVKRIEDDAFFEGRYRGRVITVHSNQRGEEADETVERLLAVENPNEPTEIVVHVNKLGEGWDVTNLYTIVPLRAANSPNLVEQSIGRGLRLPFGRRTGVKPVDRLTIVSHDHFQTIIDKANDPNSIIRTGIIIGRDIANGASRTVQISPNVMLGIGGDGTDGAAIASPSSNGGDAAAGNAPVAPASLSTTANKSSPPAAQTSLRFTSPAEQQIARATLEAVKSFETLPRAANLRDAEVQSRLVSQVTAALAAAAPAQAQLPVAEGDSTEVAQPNVAEVVKQAVEHIIEHTIDIPRIIVIPRGEVRSGFNSFTLDLSAVHLQPVAQDILIQHLRTNERERLSGEGNVVREPQLANYLVRRLIDYADISYDDHADLLYELANQTIEHLRSYLSDNGEVENVLQFHGRQLAELIHAQMAAHYWEHATEYETVVSRGFNTLRPANYSSSEDAPRPFRQPVADPLAIRNMLFSGFRRCLYPVQKFDSDTERRFSVLLEDDATIGKWFKPAKGEFRIHYSQEQTYEPDFVVETEAEKFICEPKRRNEMEDETVKAKARAAMKWCAAATKHELEHGGKPWHYLLIPHDVITSNMTLAGLAAAHTLTAN
ncbi:MAG: DEAD/DEAH box helicase family protein [Acidobacteriota bacterium]|nr:DEAD/DEAH box helicase family protein [Acidobacteriota bacterium]